MPARPGNVDLTGAAAGRSGPARAHVTLAGTLIVALSVLAWAALATWNAGPYGRYLDHGSWLDLPLLGALCRTLPAAELFTAAAFHATAWLLMIAAMMLPTVLPLVRVVSRLVLGRADSGAVLALLVLGYALAWSAFGFAAFALDALVRAEASRSAWFATHGTLLGAAVLALAGAFQFSALKYRCLDRCRTPFGFVNQHWHGRAPRRDGLRIGFAHGMFCVGCCWALMLVMFVVGMGNLAWMLLLAAVMATEKNLPIGRRLAAPVGVVLMASAGGLAISAL